MGQSFLKILCPTLKWEKIRGRGGAFFANNQSIDPKRSPTEAQEGQISSAAVFIQRAEEPDLPLAWLAPEAWRLHASAHNDAQEAEFGNA